MRSERFKELKDLEYIIDAIKDWKGININNIFEKILTSNITNYQRIWISRISQEARNLIKQSFDATKDKVLEKLMMGEIEHELFIKNYPFTKKEIFLEIGLTEKDLQEFDYFYQNLCNSYSLLNE